LGDTPAPIQTQILGSKEFEIGCITGFAAGKTRGIVAAAIAHAVRYPNSKVLLGRRTFNEVVNTVKQPFYLMADRLHRAGWFTKPLKWDYREGTQHARLINGSQFFFTNLDDPVKFRNEEYSMIVVDQAEEISEELWELLTGRIRWPLVPSEGWQAIAAANDNGHNWIWRRFVDLPAKRALSDARCPVDVHCVFDAGHPDDEGAPRPDVPCATRRFFHGTTLDNRHNLAPRYLASLMAHPPEWQRHFIYATMEGGSGRLLLDPVVVDPFDPPAGWPKYRAIDHALNSPCCCLWIAINVSGIEHKGVAPRAPYVYREYWGVHSSIDQHAARIRALTKSETITLTVIDKSAFHRTQSRQQMVVSPADIYGEEGIYCVPSVADPFPRVERINIAARRGLAVSRECQNLLRQMPEYYAEQSLDGEAKIVDKSTFHSVDALGYGLTIMPQEFDALEPGAGPNPFAGMDEVSRRHNIAEGRRLKRIQDRNDPLTRDPGITPMNPQEFWGEGEDRSDPVQEYDPWG
jgi:hypothetical protein